MAEYAALSKTPRALADGLMLVFQHPEIELADPWVPGSNGTMYKSKPGAKMRRGGLHRAAGMSRS
jgi:hypothetical protein